MAPTRDTNTAIPSKNDAELMPRPLRTLLAAAMGMCLLALTVVTVRWGMADAMYRDSDRAMERWQRARSMPDLSVWIETRDQLARASRLDPGNPAIVESSGLLHSLRVQDGSGSGVFQEEALAFFERAVVMRPTSPYTWANITLTRYRLGKTDAKFTQALGATQRLGPWEPELQLIATDFGLAAWDELDSPSRSALGATFVRAAKRQGAQMVQLGEKRGRLGLVCKVPELAAKQLKCQ
jgi:hypothetical protein